jgi:predicted phosphodiesterase
MKLAIISDVHANLEALSATLQAISRQSVDRIVVLGDIVGYNANPGECIALLRESNATIIAGNHDRAVAGVISTEGFSAAAALAVEWTRKHLSADHLAYLAALPLETSVNGHLVGVHGGLLPHGGCELTRLSSPERRKPSFESLMAHPSGARVCGFGNTHRLGIYEFRDGRERALDGDEATLREDCYYLINPGSVGQPRQSDRRATYFTFDTGHRRLSVHRVPYDFAAPVAKSCAAGLLPFYARYPRSIREPIRWTANALGLGGLARQVARARQQKRQDAAPGLDN